MADSTIIGYRPIKVENRELTTNNNGFAYFSFSDSKSHIVISCWSNSADKLCMVFPASNNTEEGKTTWWFKMLDATDLSVKSNYTSTIYYAYI